MCLFFTRLQFLNLLVAPLDRENTDAHKHDGHAGNPGNSKDNLDWDTVVFPVAFPDALCKKDTGCDHRGGSDDDQA